MGNDKKITDKSRRWFLSLLRPSDKTATKPEMIKMLTAEGKLVEIEKSVYEAVTKNKKATNKDIYNWMNNPSKDKS